MLKKFTIYFWVLVLVLFLATSMAYGKRPLYVEIAVAQGGTLTGKVRFQGEIPPPTRVDLKQGKNSEFCLENARTNDQGELVLEQVEVSGGNLKHAVVFIENIPKGKAWPKKPLVIDFKNCEAFPKIAVVRRPSKLMTKGLLIIKNHDAGVLHNPKGYSIGVGTRKIFFKKLLLNKGSKVDVTKVLKHFRKSRDSHFYVECEQHLWMSTSSRVVWNPYYDLSEKDGSFEIDQIPPGKYKVTVWHPYVGEKSFETTISKGQTTQLDIQLP